MYNYLSPAQVKVMELIRSMGGGKYSEAFTRIKGILYPEFYTVHETPDGKFKIHCKAHGEHTRKKKSARSTISIMFRSLKKRKLILIMPQYGVPGGLVYISNLGREILSMNTSINLKK